MTQFPTSGKTIQRCRLVSHSLRSAQRGWRSPHTRARARLRPWAVKTVGLSADGLPARLFNLQAVKDAVERVIQPIEDAVNAVKGFVDDLKNFFDSISFRRRLEEMTRARRLEEMTRARRLKEQAHRQLGEVQLRLLHAKDEHARGGITERLQLDINRRLEAHFTEPKLAARRRLDAGELITISNLVVKIPLNLNSRLLIEVQRDWDFDKTLVEVDEAFEVNMPLSPTPFTIRLAGSFDAELKLEVEAEADFKALLYIVINDMFVEFDLSTGAGRRAVFSEGDWTHNDRVRSAGRPRGASHMRLAAIGLSTTQSSHTSAWLKLPHPQALYRHMHTV